MPITTNLLDVSELRTMLLETYTENPEEYATAAAQINRWIARGDGVAVYENQDLGHPELGRKQYVSFGSTQALLEVGPDDLPERLPDFGGNINWRYLLVAAYYSKDRL